MVNLITYFRNIRLQLKWSAIKMVKNDQVFIEFHRRAEEWRHLTRRIRPRTVRRLTCFSFALSTQARRVWHVRVSSRIAISNTTQCSSARASSFLFSIRSLCIWRTPAKPLRAKRLMIIFIHFNLSISLAHQAGVCGASVQTLFIHRPSVRTEKCEHFLKV